MSYTTSFFHQMETARHECAASDRDDLLLILKRVEDYVSKGSFTKSPYYKAILPHILETDKEISIATGLPINNIRGRRKKYSDQIFNKLGYDFFDLLHEDGGPAEMEARIVEAESGEDLTELVLPEIASQAYGMTYPPGSLRIADCRYEVELIRYYCTDTLNKNLSRADRSKLQYLIDVLHGRTGTADERKRLSQFIKANKSLTINAPLAKREG